MKLRLKAFRNAAQNSFLAQSAAGIIQFSKIGDISPDLPSAVAYSLLGLYPDMLEALPETDVETKAVASAPQNKEVAAAPANKGWDAAKATKVKDTVLEA